VAFRRDGALLQRDDGILAGGYEELGDLAPELWEKARSARGKSTAGL
jgi:hypothetical protein